MEKLIFLFLILLISCNDDVVDDSTKEKSFVGATFSGYSYTSFFDNRKMYSGYKFISKDSVTSMLLEENSRIISKKNLYYILEYPKIRIQDTNTMDGYWHGEFNGDNTLIIKDIVMTRWN